MKYKGCSSCCEEAIERASRAECELRCAKEKYDSFAKELISLRESNLGRLWSVKWERKTGEYPKPVHSMQRVNQRLFSSYEAAKAFVEKLNAALKAERILHCPDYDEEHERNYFSVAGCGEDDVKGYTYYSYYGWDIEIRTVHITNNTNPCVSDVHFQ